MHAVDSSLPLIAPPAHPIAQRMTPERYATRVERQRNRERYQSQRYDPLYLISRIIPVNQTIRWGLKATGLYRHARREFTTPRLVHLEHRCPRWPAAFDGLRILHLTDLHIDIDPGLIPAILAGIEGAECDLCVITGDFRNSHDTPRQEVLQLSQRILEALPQPVYGTLGNHDEVELAEPLEATGLIRLLMNEHVVLPFRGGQFTLAGIDDTFFHEAGDIPAAMAGAPTAQESPRILLAHGPDIVEEADRHQVAFTPCGHTHGGQICLPGGKPLLAIDKLPSHLLAGAWRAGDMIGYTSRGTGGCRVPVRLNCPAEITLHTLRPA